MMITVFYRLHEMKSYGFLGSTVMLVLVISVPVALYRDLKVFEHSVLFIVHTFTVPPEDTLNVVSTLYKCCLINKEEIISNSFGVFSDVKP